MVSQAFGGTGVSGIRYSRGRREEREREREREKERGREGEKDREIEGEGDRDTERERRERERERGREGEKDREIEGEGDRDTQRERERGGGEKERKGEKGFLGLIEFTVIRLKQELHILYVMFCFANNVERIFLFALMCSESNGWQREFSTRQLQALIRGSHNTLLVYVCVFECEKERDKEIVMANGERTN